MKILDRIKNDPNFLVFMSSLAALILAYGSEFLFDLVPCMLCIYQRIPYFILFFISLICIASPKSKGYFLYFIIPLYLLEIILAGYHIGVEHYWIEENYVCQSDGIMEALTTKNIAASCSEVKFKFMNFSMAEWNFIYAGSILYWFIRSVRRNG